MHLPEALRHQHFDLGPDHLRARVAEQTLGLGVDDHDLACPIDDDDGVGCRLQQATELLFCLLSVADVADRAHHESARFGLDRAQADFDRKFGAVLAQTEQLDVAPHGAGTGEVEVLGAVADVGIAGAMGQQDLDRLPCEFATLVTEKPFGLDVGEDDSPLLVHHDDTVRHRFQQVPETGFDQTRLALNGLVHDHPCVEAPSRPGFHMALPGSRVVHASDRGRASADNAPIRRAWVTWSLRPSDDSRSRPSAQHGRHAAQQRRRQQVVTRREARAVLRRPDVCFRSEAVVYVNDTCRRH
jgi:hypothetical protein